MARLTQRHEIAFIVRPAVRKRTDMMTLRGWGQSALLKALLTQRVLTDVRPADFSPLGAVTLAAHRVAFVTVIVSVHSLLMLGAVTAVRQLRAAGVAARLLWLSRHSSHLHSDKVKAL